MDMSGPKGNRKRHIIIQVMVITIVVIVVGILVVSLMPLMESEHVKQSDRQLHMFTNGKVGFAYNPPTLVDDFIYIGTSRSLKYMPASENFFYKLDSDLNKIWEYPLGKHEVRGAATLDTLKNVYFVVNHDRIDLESSDILELYSLDNDGNFRWAKEISPPGDRGDGMITPAISEDDTIYVGGVYKEQSEWALIQMAMFYAFDSDGNQKWNYLPGGNVNSAPIIDPSGNIYFVASKDIISLDKNGLERWRYSSNEIGNGVSSPAFTTDYSHLIVALWQTIYCIESSNGELTWKYTIPGMLGDFRATPAVDDNNDVYIISHGIGGEQDDSTMYAIKSDGSGIIWQNNIGSDGYSSPALGDDRVLYVGSEGFGNTGDKHNRLHALDMETGEILWSAELDTDVTWSSPAISNEGILYIATFNINDEVCGVYSFRTDSTGLLANAGSPRFHEGNASTGRRE